MAAFWEGIPLVGPALSATADVVESGLNGAAGIAAALANRAAGIALGEDRKKKLATEFSAWLIDTVGGEDQLVDITTDVVKKSGKDPLSALIAEVLRRSLDVLCHVFDLMDPGPLFESLLKTARCLINRIHQGYTEAARKLFGEVLNSSLRLIYPTLDEIDPNVLLVTLGGLTQTVLTSILAKVGNLDTIQSGVMSNDLNAATIGLLWTRRGELVSWVVDVVECAKCYATAMSLDGEQHQDNPHGVDNEFDFSQAMNRHALVCQAQRLVKSLVFILSKAADPVTFSEIDMTTQTQLCSDILDSGAVLEIRPSGWQRVIRPYPAGEWVRIPPATPAAKSETSAVAEPGESAAAKPKKSVNGEPKKSANAVQETPATAKPGTAEPEDREEDKAEITNEKWLFVNGIANELFWLHLSCKKLAKWYSREVTGVYNRADGILWDLVECAGQRDRYGKGSVESQKNMVVRTRSSQLAQESLKEQLQAALEQAKDGKKYEYVVMIAHSQGCLVLRLVLEQLLDQGSESIHETMRERLCVFTFGNPSVDWKMDPQHVLRTEHFANKKDFVAQLGVISEHKQADSGYEREYVFVNREKDWIGHLFGTQYSLDSRHYKDEYADERGEVTGYKSWLLGCMGGKPLSEARRKVGG
ncbi:hypothetical protein MPH_04169 [Macrophomina phaseolina MS6]|uniref:DUF676 domain-containing protein n=1 Tax=Macrophomina phaseolina (strain MS6) TaxID=1126212 RepID=K2R864_MACPH|nr:hypothetical protein MPH_04169 [Macrophomina phaseolina MS6]